MCLRITRGAFYYKGELDAKKVALPWNFDVSYKLNGVPKNADELAGASGLIEIHIDAKFNDSADVNEYYKNNFCSGRSSYGGYQ